MSDYEYDSTGVKMDAPGGKFTLPDGDHTFRIVEAKPGKSKKGYFMVECICEVINELDLIGRRLKHWVTFLPPESKGAGMAIHFLKVIGQPWEGKFKITSADWIGCTFVGKTKTEPYTNKEGKTFQQSKIDSVDYLPGAKAADEIPF